MKVELRSDGVHISGYVNVTGRQSRPVLTPRGRVIEVVEQRAFARAIERAGGKVNMLLDHNPNRLLASTIDGTLTVSEDEIGLRAEAVVADAEVIEGAKSKKLRGWSFGMKNVVDSVEERADALPIRHVKDFNMYEISLLMYRNPVYSATSVEIRADKEEEVEERALNSQVEFVLPEPEPQPEPPKYDNSAFKARLDALKQ